MDFDKVIKERKSVRKFHSKKPNWRHIIEAFETGLQAPIAGNISSVRFILVDDPVIIAKLTEASQQDFVADTSYVAVVCSDPVDTIRSYGKELGERYVRQQAGAAIENFLLKLVDLGLGACWVGAFDEDEIRSALKIPDNIYIEAIIPVGYSIDKTPRKKHPSLDRSIYFNKYKMRFMKPRKEVEAL